VWTDIVQAKDFLNYVVEFEQLTKLELWTDRNLVLRNGGRAGGLVFDSAKKKKKMNRLHAQKIGRPFKLVTINVKGYPQAQD
jgi:hypothetical protein